MTNQEDEDYDDEDSTHIPIPSNEPDTVSKPVELQYTPEFEQLLKENGDHAQVYSILHQMAHLKYRRRFDMINIPLIILTAVIGFITGIDVQYASMGIILGAGSVAVSITKSVLAYLKMSEQSENHRICSLQFGQIANEIKTELSLRKEQRQPPKIMLDVIKVKLKNLMEVAHILDRDVIRAFQEKYMDADKTETYTKAGVTFPPVFSTLPGIKILGANTDQDREKQLESTLKKLQMDHNHERQIIEEDLKHGIELRKLKDKIREDEARTNAPMLRQSAMSPQRVGASSRKAISPMRPGLDRRSSLEPSDERDILIRQRDEMLRVIEDQARMLQDAKDHEEQIRRERDDILQMAKNKDDRLQFEKDTEEASVRVEARLRAEYEVKQEKARAEGRELSAPPRFDRYNTKLLIEEREKIYAERAAQMSAPIVPPAPPPPPAPAVPSPPASPRYVRTESLRESLPPQ